MAKKDINLFKAAGGERAKATKSSPMSIMIIIGIIVVVLALGVGVYFNLKVNSAKNEYLKKEDIKNKYLSTRSYVRDLSEEYKKVVTDIESAAAIDEYVQTRSALYPEATATEIAAVQKTIEENPLGEPFSLNIPEESEPFTPRDYQGLRESLYADDVEPIEDRELIYYALLNLADKQEELSDESVWYAYYRCYMVVVFTGGDVSGMGLPTLCDALISSSGTMDGSAPFSKFEMDNLVFDGGMYTPAKYVAVPYGEEVYNILLLPMKSVVERAFDILEGHSAALIEANGWETQTERASYGVDNIRFENESLAFDLILPAESSLKGYLDEFDASVFFDVDQSVVRSEGQAVSGGISYSVAMGFKNRPDFTTTED